MVERERGEGVMEGRKRCRGSEGVMGRRGSDGERWGEGGEEEMKGGGRGG